MHFGGRSEFFENWAELGVGLALPFLKSISSSVHIIDSDMHRSDSDMHRPDSDMHRPDSDMHRPDSDMHTHGTNCCPKLVRMHWATTWCIFPAFGAAI